MASKTRPQRYREGDEPVPGYRLLRWLGEGGMGEVWKAQSSGGVEVAMKVIYGVHQKAGRKELRALQLVKSVRHPNLVPIIAFWLKDEDGNLLDDTEVPAAAEVPARKTGDVRATLDISSIDTDPGDVGPSNGGGRAAQLIIAMGLGDSSLFNRLEECQAQGLPGVPVEELLEYLEAAARAIDKLNIEHGIQHCDIKPQNILIVGGAAQVCDFGLAKAIGDTRRTSANAVTIAYGSPEVLMHGEPSESTDQYSLAMSYFELRTGQLPFNTDTMTGVIDAKRTGELQLDKLPELEREVIRRATALDPKQRYPRNLDMARALRAAYYSQQGDPTAEVEQRIRRPSDTAVVTTSPPPRKSKAPALAALVGLLLLATGTAAYLVAGDRLLTWFGQNEKFISLDEVRRELDPLLSAARFSDAAAFVSALPEQRRQEAIDIVSSAWRSAAQTLMTAGSPRRALDEVDRLLDAFPEDASARRLRGEVLSDLLEATRVKLQELGDTGASLSEVQSELEYLAAQAAHRLSERDRPSVQAAVVIQQARLAARRNPEQFEQLLPSLPQKVDEVLPMARPDWLALQVLGASTPEALLRSLAELQEADAARQLGLWERRQVDARRDQLLKQLGSMQLDDQQQQMVARIWSENVQVDLLLVEADELRRQAQEQGQPGKLSESRQRLDEARGLASDPAMLAKIDVLRAMIEIQDPTSEADMALASYRKAIAVAGAPADQLAEALASRFEYDSAHRDAALRLISETWPQVPDAQRAAVERQQARLLLARLREQVVQSPLQFERLWEDSEQLRGGGTHDAVVDAAWAEAAMERAGEQLDLPNWLNCERAVRAAVGALERSPDEPLRDYVGYVAVLLAARNPTGAELGKVADNLLELLAGGPPSAALEVPSRRARMADILEQAADSLRQASPDELTTPAFSAATARQAIMYLDTARQLGSSEPRLTSNLALAHAALPEPDWDVIRDLNGQLRPPTESSVQLLLARARAHSRATSPESLAEAVRTYSLLLDKLHEDSMVASPRDRYELIVEPALEAVAALNNVGRDTPETNLAIARVYHHQARLIREFPVVEEMLRSEREIADPIRVAYEALRTASSLAPSAELLVDQGLALMELPDPGDIRLVDQLNKLADEALALDESYAPAHGLKGRALVFTSRAEPVQGKKQEPVNQALASYDRALRLAEPDSKYHAAYLIGRSGANLELSFLESKRPSASIEAMRRYLQQAVADAAAATNIDNRPNPEIAWNALGNAEEDVALYLGEDLERQYEKAETAFNEAIRSAVESGRSAAGSYLNLGRSRFRSVQAGTASGAAREQRLRMAVQNLLQASSQSTSKVVQAEAQLWLSQVYLYQGLQVSRNKDDLEKAEDACAEAVRLAQEANWFELPQAQGAWIALALHRNDYEAAWTRAQQLRAMADDPATPGQVTLDQLYAAFKAMWIAGRALQHSTADRVALVDEMLPIFAPEDASTTILRARILIERSSELVELKGANWRSYRQTALDDAEQCLRLLEELSPPTGAIELAHSHGILGTVRFKDIDMSNIANSGTAGREARTNLKQAIAGLKEDIPGSLRYRMLLAAVCRALAVDARKTDDAASKQLRDEGLDALRPVKPEHTQAYDQVQQLRAALQQL